MGRSRGVWGERTKHTKTFRRTLAGFGLTWHRKVHFSTFSGKLTCQCNRNGPQNLPFRPGSLQDTFIIYSSILHQPIFRKYSAKITHIENRKSENLKIQKPRFTNRSPAFLLRTYFLAQAMPLAFEFRVHWPCQRPTTLPLPPAQYGFSLGSC